VDRLHAPRGGDRRPRSRQPGHHAVRRSGSAFQPLAP